MSTRESLQQLEIFSHFSPPQLAALAGCVARRRCPAGTGVVRQGETTSDAYLVETGTVRIQRETPYGVFVLAELGRGEMFGEASFLDQGPRSGDVVTAADSELLILSPAALADVCGADRRLSLALHWAFWKSLSRKLRQTNEKLARFFSGGAEPAEGAPSAPEPGPESFRVGLAAKRRLFEEQRLSNMEINFLASLSRERKLGPGQALFREGDAGTEMYVVLEGRVMISKNIPGAGEEALAFLERGSYFGEMALIDRQPRSADAKADDRGAVVLAISREVLEGILDIEKMSSLRLLQILCGLIADRLREIDDKIVGWFILSGGHQGQPG